MTNYEAMRTMDKDELAKFLSSIMDCKKCPASEKYCDGHRDCDDAILNWLNAESDDRVYESVQPAEKGGKAMTNYEAIKAMGMNELAGFLASITTCGECSDYCPARNCGGHEVCTAALLEWLNAESDDDTVVEHSEGQTINISHANVVIFD